MKSANFGDLQSLHTVLLLQKLELAVGTMVNIQSICAPVAPSETPNPISPKTRAFGRRPKPLPGHLAFLGLKAPKIEVPYVLRRASFGTLGDLGAQALTAF